MSSGDAAQPREPRIRALELPDLSVLPIEDVAAGDDREAVHVQGAGPERLDWTRVTLRECVVGPVQAAELLLDRGRLLETRIDEPDITGVQARDSTWRSVEVQGGRLAALDLAGCTWDGVAASGTRLGYVNLRDARLTDVALANCRIETLDLATATAQRVSLDGCVIDELVVTHGTLHDVDLRRAQIGRIEGVGHLAGTTISAAQLLDLAPWLARELGITVEP